MMIGISSNDHSENDDCMRKIVFSMSAAAYGSSAEPGTRSMAFTTPLSFNSETTLFNNEFI